MTRSFSRLSKTIPLVAAAILHAGCGGLSVDEQATFDRGLTALESGDWASADSAFTAVLETHPSLASALLHRGRARFGLGKFEPAIADFAAAEGTEELAPEEQRIAWLFSGRAHFGFGESIEQRMSNQGTPEDLRLQREARTQFVRGNAFVSSALAMAPDDYDARLWRAYGYLKIENFQQSLEWIAECERTDPNRWEHRHFKALALEGIYGINAESVQLMLDIATRHDGPELAPLYLHLVAVFDRIESTSQRRAVELIEAFAHRHPNPPEAIATFLEEARARIAAEDRKNRIRAAIAKSRELVTLRQYEGASKLIAKTTRVEGETPELRRALSDAHEHWSRHLEGVAVTLSASDDVERLERALEHYLKAQTLTRAVDRLATLQQRINAVQIALKRRETSKTLAESYELLGEKEYRRVLSRLSSVSIPALTDNDKDLFHYLRGVASFHLGEWRTAAKALESIEHRRFQNQSEYLGLALVRSGRSDAGIRLLRGLADSTKNPDVHRVIGSHYAENGRPEDALAQYAKIASPTKRDRSAQFLAHRAIADRLYASGAWKRALSHYRDARRLLESGLDERAVEVYLRLGNCLFYTKDFQRAKEVYSDLSNSELSRAETKACRDLYRYRAQIHLREQAPELAYRDFIAYERLGGKITDEALTRRRSRLVAAYADFAPLERIHHWDYVDRAKSKTYRVVVGEKTGDAYTVERREERTVSTETWHREGAFLVKKIARDVWRVPVNLNPAADEYPQTEYSRKDGDVEFLYRTEVLSFGETIALANGKEVSDVLKVKLWRRRSNPERGTTSFLVYTVYLAPDIGEIRREVKLDNVDVSTVVLSDFAYRSETLGN